MGSDIASLVNFYILPDSDLQQRLIFVCRLAEKSRERQLKTVIISCDKTQAKDLDLLLWTRKPEQFMPHEIISAKTQEPLPNLLLLTDIAQLNTVDFTPELVIDLSYDALPLHYPKIMLVANQHADVLSNARMKYQSYVNTGIKPTVHKIKENQS